MKSLLLPLVALLVITTSCRDDEDQAETDRNAILKYIADNNLNAQSTSSSLYYVIENEGTGKRPNAQSDVQVVYKGMLVDGTVFDESSSQGLWLNLGQVIRGWQEGIPLFKEGGKGILLIPSALGYGSNPTGGIPANSVLIFEITLRDVR